MTMHGGAYVDTSHYQVRRRIVPFRWLGDRVQNPAGFMLLGLFRRPTPRLIQSNCGRGLTRWGVEPLQVLVCRNAGLSTCGYGHSTIRWDDRTRISYRRRRHQPDGTVTTSGAGLANGIWYHIAVDKDSTGKVRIYVNGAMKASDTPANSVIWSGIMEVSVGCTGTSAFPEAHSYGNIDDVRITMRSRYGDVYGDAGFLPSGAQFPDHA